MHGNATSRRVFVHVQSTYYCAKSYYVPFFFCYNCTNEQLREAQESVPQSLMKQIIETEQLALSTLCTTVKLPVGAAIMIVWKSMNYSYIRCMDFGVLSGFCEVMRSRCTTNSVHDIIATTTDLKRLTALRRKKREKDIDKVFNKFSCLPTSQYCKLSVCLVLLEDSGQHIRHVSHGTCFDGPTIVENCQRHILESCAHVDHMQQLQDIISSNPVQLSFSQQLATINCLPSVNLSFNTGNHTSRHSVAEGRVRTSCKFMFIRDEFTDINAIHSSGISSVVFRKRGSTRKGVYSSVCTLNDEDSDYFEMSDESSLPTGQRSSFTLPIVEKFKFCLQRQGLIRVTKRSDLEIDIVWNKYDSVKGIY